jgi:hypothetical protein
MKKVLFALEVFSIIALFISYPVLELSRGSAKPAATIIYQAVTIEKTRAIPESISVNEQTLIPLPVKIVAVLLKFPS